jgi:hypothetical protein
MAPLGARGIAAGDAEATLNGITHWEQIVLLNGYLSSPSDRWHPRANLQTETH